MDIASLYEIARKGIPIPAAALTLLPSISNAFNKSQLNQISRAMQTGRGFTIKPTRKQIEGGFLGTLASIGIPIAVSLVSKMLGGGLHVDRSGLSNVSNVYVPSMNGQGYPYQSPPFIGTWGNPIGMGIKKKKTKTKGKGLLLGKDSPFNSIPIIGSIL